MSTTPTPTHTELLYQWQQFCCRHTATRITHLKQMSSLYKSKPVKTVFPVRYKICTCLTDIYFNLCKENTEATAINLWRHMLTHCYDLTKHIFLGNVLNKRLQIFPGLSIMTGSKHIKLDKDHRKWSDSSMLSLHLSDLHKKEEGKKNKNKKNWKIFHS